MQGVKAIELAKKKNDLEAKTSFDKFYLYVPSKTRIFRGSLINQS